MKSAILISGILLWALPVRGQAVADSAAIRATALDYIEGWYAGNPDRMERALHPHLAKRRVVTDSAGHSRLQDMTAMELVQGTRAAYGKEVPVAQRRTDVTILDIYGNAASVKVDAGAWIDYLHIAKWNGCWEIVNVLWETPPRP